MEIDWANARMQIQESCILNDAQVEEALETLDYAKQLYSQGEIPQNIVLLDKHGSQIHKIVTRTGVPKTVYVQLSFVQRYRDSLIVGLALSSIIGLLYLKYKKN